MLFPMHTFSVGSSALRIHFLLCTFESFLVTTFVLPVPTSVDDIHCFMRGFILFVGRWLVILRYEHFSFLSFDLHPLVSPLDSYGSVFHVSFPSFFLTDCTSSPTVVCKLHCRRALSILSANLWTSERVPQLPSPLISVRLCQLLFSSVSDATSSYAFSLPFLSIDFSTQF